MTKKLIVRLFGGIGNQLFIYAAARRFSIAFGYKLVLDDLSGFRSDTVYNRSYALDCFSISVTKAGSTDRLEPFPRLRRYILRLVNLFLPLNLRSYIQQEFLGFDPRIINLRPKARTIHFEGYWQSEKYFYDVESVIRRDLTFKPPTDSKNISVSKSILMYAQNSVAIHYRFFDEASANYLSKYYTDSISYFEHTLDTPHYFVFTDNPTEASKTFPLSLDRCTFVTHNQSPESSYCDLWLMSLCHNFIIANSTFSWWGAWLSPYKDKIVVAPKRVIKEDVGAWGFEDLLPESWLKL